MFDEIIDDPISDSCSDAIHELIEGYCSCIEPLVFDGQHLGGSDDLLDLGHVVLGNQGRHASSVASITTDATANSLEWERLRAMR